MTSPTIGVHTTKGAHMQRRLFAEFLGTFWLVFMGCGSAVLAAAFPEVGIGLLGVSLAFGLTVVTMAYAVGHISGGHFNPAVSLGLYLGGRFTARELGPYIVTQVLAGILAAGLLLAVANGTDTYDIDVNGLAANGFGDASPGGYGLAAALLIELLLTFFFLFVILGVTDRRAPSGFGPLAIGLCLTLIHLVSIPVTNTSVNPARSTGPALFVGGDALSQLWLFWLAPLAGAALAGLAYRFLTGEQGISSVATEGQEIAGSDGSIGEVDTERGSRGRGARPPARQPNRRNPKRR